MISAIMNVGPPPLPSYVRPQPTSVFARQASQVCLAAPVIIIVLSMLIHGFSQNHNDPSGRALFLVFGLVTAGFFFVGVIFGILALVLAKSGERRPVIMRALCGLTMLGLLVAIAIPNFISARAQALRRKQSLQELHSAVTEVRAKAAAALTNGGKTTVDPQALLRSFNAVEKNSSGDTAALFKCSQQFIKDELAYQQAYTQAASELTAAKVLVARNLEQREQITQRKKLVQKFIDTNGAFKTFLVQGEAAFRKELQAAGVSTAQIDEALTGFRKTWQPQAPLLISIREADDRFGRELLTVLDLFDTQWGQWRYDTNAHLVRFEDRNAVRQFNDLMAEIKQTSSEQAAAQKRLADLLSQSSGSL